MTPARKILVAEDDASMRDLIATALTRAGFDVTTTADGQQAWERLLA